MALRDERRLRELGKVNDVLSREINTLPELDGLQ
jgi:hypothetical protein